MFRSAILLRQPARRVFGNSALRSFSKAPRASRSALSTLALANGKNSVRALGRSTVLGTRGQQMALFSSGGGSSKEGGHALEKAKYIDETINPKEKQWEVMTTGEKVKEGSKTGMILGIAGLVLVCGFYIARELMPTGMSPNTVFSRAFDVAKEHPDVTNRLGTPLTGHGHDHGGRREGRRNILDSDKYVDEFGQDVVRIKFDLEGPRGKGIMYAAVASNTKRGKLQYLIFQEVSTGRSYVLIDNRKAMTDEDEQKKLANGIVNLGGVMYGSEQSDDTQRQKMEFGDFFDKIKYMECDKHGLDKESDETCTKLKMKFPAWKFDDRVYQGVFSRKNMTKLLKQEQAYANLKKKQKE
jgi:hypothetical protein